MLTEASVICHVLISGAIQVVHIPGNFERFAYQTVATDLLAQVLMLCNVSTVIRTRECFEDEPPLAPSRTVRAVESNGAKAEVLLLAGALAMFDLEALQMTCYPFVGVWCYLQDSFRPERINKGSDIFRQCDAFMITDSDQIHVRHLIRDQDGLKMFTLQPPEDVCNKAGVLTLDGEFQDTFGGLTLKQTGANLPAYNYKSIPARNLSSFQTGIVQGFERSIIEAARDFLNFTLVDYDAGLDEYYGHRPQPDTYWDGSLIKHLITRKVHLSFSDFSILSPRHLFVDFTYTHDIDVACFLAKVDIQLYSGGSLLKLIAGPVSATYISCAIMITLWFTISRIGIPKTMASNLFMTWIGRASLEFIHLFTFFGSYIVHPHANGFKVRDLRSLCLLVLWKFGMFWMSAFFCSVLISFVTNPRIQGKCDTLVGVAKVLKTVSKSRIYTTQIVKNVFDQYTRGSSSQLFQTLSLYMEIHEQSEYTDVWRRSRVAFLFAESLMARRYVWAYDMGDRTYQTSEHTYNTYQAVGFQKGCVLRNRMSSVTQRLVETGHVLHFKKFGGIFLGNNINVPFEERPLELETFASIFLVIGIGYGLSIVVVLVEILDNYEFNRPIPQTQLI